MRAPAFMVVVLASAACAPSPAPEPPPAGLVETRCIAADGSWRQNPDGSCQPGAVLTRIEACADGEAPSVRWHDAVDPARGRAAQDGSLIGDRDSTGRYCLPAPPR